MIVKRKDKIKEIKSSHKNDSSKPNIFSDLAILFTQNH